MSGTPLVTPEFFSKLYKAMENDPGIVSKLNIGAMVEIGDQKAFYIFEDPIGKSYILSSTVTQTGKDQFRILTSKLDVRKPQTDSLEDSIKEGLSIVKVNEELDRLYFSDSDRKAEILKAVSALSK